jgi:AcrR family transcriptional regulator
MTDHSTGPHRSVDERITAAALALIAERGLAGVSMTEVATTAGVARQTLYNRYPDVDSIVVAALEEHNAAMTAQLRGLIDTASTSADAIDLLVRQTIAAAAHGPEFTEFYIGLSPDARKIIDQHDDQVREVIRTIIATGIHSNEFAPDIDAQASSIIIQAMLTGGLRLAHITGDQAAAVTTTTTMILNTLIRPTRT